MRLSAVQLEMVTIRREALGNSLLIQIWQNKYGGFVQLLIKHFHNIIEQSDQSYGNIITTCTKTYHIVG